MHVELPKDLKTQAKWWCALNGWECPEGVPAGCSGEEIMALFNEVNRLPGVLKAGLALWRARWDMGLYPQNGKPRPLARFIGSE